MSKFNNFGLGFAVGYAIALILIFMFDARPFSEAVESGHAHYDSKTGDIVWNSGNCSEVQR